MDPSPDSFLFSGLLILPEPEIPSRAVLPTASLQDWYGRGARPLYYAAAEARPRSAYGLFRISASLIIWSYVSDYSAGRGAVSANRHALRLAASADVKADRKGGAR